MRQLSFTELGGVLDAAFRDRICVQAWLGHANVLFLGLGEEILPPPIIDAQGHRQHLLPLYELESDYSQWRLYREGADAVTSDDKRYAQDAIKSLVGLRVVGWRIVEPRWELHVTFEGGSRLEVVPYADADLKNRDIWSVRAPDGYYSTVTAMGNLYQSHETEPPSQQNLPGR